MCVSVALQSGVRGAFVVRVCQWGQHVDRDWVLGARLGGQPPCACVRARARACRGGSLCCVALQAAAADGRPCTHLQLTPLLCACCETVRALRCCQLGGATLSVERRGPSRSPAVSCAGVGSHSLAPNVRGGSPSDSPRTGTSEGAGGDAEWCSPVPCPERGVRGVFVSWTGRVCQLGGAWLSVERRRSFCSPSSVACAAGVCSACRRPVAPAHPLGEPEPAGGVLGGHRNRGGAEASAVPHATIHTSAGRPRRSGSCTHAQHAYHQIVSLG
jgi:hypothetical protein